MLNFTMIALITVPHTRIQDKKNLRGRGRGGGGLTNISAQQDEMGSEANLLVYMHVNLIHVNFRGGGYP